VTFVHVDDVTIGDGRNIEDLYTLVSITGWRDGVDYRRDRTPRPARHGEFSTRGYKSGRLVRVEVEVSTPSSHAVRHVEALDRLIGILDDGGEGQLTIDDDDRKLWAMASRYGAPEVTPIQENVLSAVALRFLTPDPRRYSIDETKFGPAATLTLFHEGNSAALPTLSVQGPSAGYTLTFSTGDVVTVPGGLAAGQSDVLSGATQWVKRAGSTLPLLGTTGHVPEIPKGRDVTVTVAGAASISGTVAHTYS